MLMSEAHYFMETEPEVIPDDVGGPDVDNDPIEDPEAETAPGTEPE